MSVGDRDQPVPAIVFRVPFAKYVYPTIREPPSGNGEVSDVSGRGRHKNERSSARTADRTR